MDGSLAFLLSSLLTLFTVGNGASLSLNVVRTKVKDLAQIMLARIQKHSDEMAISPGLVIGGLDTVFPEAPVDQPLEGLSSMVELLGVYQEGLRSLPPHELTQLREEVSYLRVLLENLRVVHCLGQSQKQREQGPLEEYLQSHKERFNLSVIPVALTSLKGFLGQLLSNLDQIRTC